MYSKEQIEVAVQTILMDYSKLSTVDCAKLTDMVLKELDMSSE